MSSRRSDEHLPQLYLRSLIPGRERWDLPLLRGKPGLAHSLEKALAQCPGVTRVRADPISSRVLVLYSTTETQVNVESLIFDCLQELSSTDQSSSDGHRHSLAKVLAESLPDHKALVRPILWSLLGRSLQLIQGLLFISTVTVARGEASGLPFLRGLSKGAQVKTMTGLSLVVAGISLWVDYRRRRAWQMLALETQHRLRGKLFANILRQDLAFFDSHGTGRLISLVSEDTAKVKDFVERAGDEFVEKGLTIVVAVTVLTAASPLLGFVACLPLPFMFLPRRFYGKKTEEVYAQVGERAGRFSQMLSNTLLGIADVKSFNASEQEVRRLQVCESLLEEASMEASSVSTIQSHLGQSIFTIAYTATSVIGGNLAAEGKVRQATYSRILFLFPQLLGAVAGIEDLTGLFDKASNSARQIAEVLDSRPAIISGPQRLSPAAVRGEVVFEDVSFGYDPAIKILKNVSFEMRPGQTLAIVGPTGSGKSTILRLLLRFYDVDSGRILLDGIDIRELNIEDLRAAIGLVNQDVYLFQGTVRDNLLYGSTPASDAKIDQAMRSAGIADLIESLHGDGLDADVGEGGRKLSGGEKQCVAIARALLKNAPILALDEATSHLDYETEFAVKRSLRKAAGGQSVISIAHRLLTVRDADKIVVLEEGHIKEQGSHEALIANEGLYHSLWQLQDGRAS